MTDLNFDTLRGMFTHPEGDGGENLGVIRQYLQRVSADSITRTSKTMIAESTDNLSLRAATEDVHYLSAVRDAVPDETLAGIRDALRGQFFAIQDEVNFTEWQQHELMTILDGASDDEYDQIINALPDKIRSKFIAEYLHDFVKDSEDESENPMVRFLKRNPSELPKVQNCFGKHCGLWYENLSFE